MRIRVDASKLVGLLERLNRRALLGAGAKAIERTIRRAFRSLPSRSGFFEEMVAGGRVTTPVLTDDEAVVKVDSRELAHYIRGGPVRPLPPRKALAIPQTQRARDAGSPSLGNIPDLFMVKRRGKNPLLCATEGKHLVAHYALVGGVTHRPHPEHWPEAEIRNSAAKAMQQELEHQLSGGT